LRGRRARGSSHRSRLFVGRAEGSRRCELARRRQAEADRSGPTEGRGQPAVWTGPVRRRVPPVQPGGQGGAVRPGRGRCAIRPRRHVRGRVQQHGRLPATAGQLRTRPPAVRKGARHRPEQRQGPGAPMPGGCRAPHVRRCPGRRRSRLGHRTGQRGCRAIPGRGRARRGCPERSLRRHGQEDVRLKRPSSLAIARHTIVFVLI